jgi:hypothetical protein
MIDIEFENELQSYLYSLTRTTAHSNEFQIPIVNFDDRAGLTIFVRPKWIEITIPTSLPCKVIIGCNVTGQC